MQTTSNKEILAKEWNQIYHSKASKFILVGNIEGYKFRKEGNHFVIGNKSGIQKKPTEVIKLASKNKSVFMQFDAKQFSFSNASNKQILFYVNLDQEEIITKESAAKITQNFFDKEQGQQNQQIQGHAHPVLINTTPIYPYHSLLAMYPDEELPQIVGSDIVLLLLNIFKIFPGIKIGYNSIGGGASINNLHFHLFYSEDLIGEAKMPIQHEKRTLWKKTSLVNPKQEINLYNVGVNIQEINSNMCQAFVISPFGEDLQASQVSNSLSYAFGLLVNELIQLNIPHNVLFSSDGNVIYVIVRQFVNPQTQKTFGWLQFSGVVYYDFETTQQDIIKQKKKLLVPNQLVEQTKKNVSKHLQKYI